MSEDLKAKELEPTQNKYFLPFPEETVVDHITRDNIAHQGVFKGAMDLAVPLGTPVFSPLDGVVKRVVDHNDQYGNARRFNGLGNLIFIEHPNGEFSELIHLAKGSSLVKVGDEVKKGQQVAVTGLSGWMSGPHLHWIVCKRDPNPKGFRGLEIQFEEDTKENLKLVKGF